MKNVLKFGGGEVLGNPFGGGGNLDYCGGSGTMIKSKGTFV